MTTAQPLALSAGGRWTVNDGLSLSDWPWAPGAPSGQRTITGLPAAELSAARSDVVHGTIRQRPQQRKPKQKFTLRLIGGCSIRRNLNWQAGGLPYVVSTH